MPKKSSIRRVRRHKRQQHGNFPPLLALLAAAPSLATLASAAGIAGGVASAGAGLSTMIKNSKSTPAPSKPTVNVGGQRTVGLRPPVPTKMIK